MLKSKNSVPLSDNNLATINGGVLPVVVAGGALLGFLAKDAWEHSDQIYKGFIKGWK